MGEYRIFTTKMWKTFFQAKISVIQINIKRGVGCEKPLDKTKASKSFHIVKCLKQFIIYFKYILYILRKNSG